MEYFKKFFQPLLKPWYTLVLLVVLLGITVELLPLWVGWAGIFLPFFGLTVYTIVKK